MGVYSVMLPDEKLIQAIQGFKRIAILGCEGCANESLAYDKNMPQKAVYDPYMKEHRPAPEAVTSEANRLKAVFKNVSNDIQVITGMGLCLRSVVDQEPEWIKACNGMQVVVALSCMGGIIGIRKGLSNEIKVIPGMMTAGVLYSYREFDSAKGLLYINKEKSASVILFKKE